MQAIVLMIAAPTALMIGFALLGWMNPWASGAAATLIAGLTLAIAWRLHRDVGALSHAMRRQSWAHGSPPHGSPPEHAPPVKLLQSLNDELFLLARRLASHAARSERNRLADTMILERLPDPVLVLAQDLDVIRSNAAARSVFGDDVPAVLRYPGLRAAIDLALTQNLTQTAEVRLAVPAQRDVLATVVPIHPPLDDGGRAVVVLSDRTRERLVEQMRADFVANVSHELRTPLASVIGFIETLRGAAADDPKAQQYFLGIMADQGARMNRLMDDLLSLSRIELNEHQPPNDSLDLAELLPRLVAGFAPRLAERKARIDLRIADGLPKTTGDADQMAQVVQNLLENAVKYGKDGGTIRLSAETATPGDRWPNRRGLMFSVVDTGMGIPKEHLPRLTERFYRVDKGRSRAVGGTGLGLAIVKHIVNRHRGHLLIESEVGVGTTVSVWLPLSNPPA